jgi:anthranilate synthase component 1
VVFARSEAYVVTSFDIPVDLLTPAGVFLQLRPLRPRCLLESVESGLRQARYSYIVFGDVEDWRLDPDGLQLGPDRRARPADAAELLSALRAGLARLPPLEPQLEDVPLQGGLIGASSYELARYFEPQALSSAPLTRGADAHYLAPRSLLVFDHASRSMALLHAGAESERQALRREVLHALRSPMLSVTRAAHFSPPEPSVDAAQFMHGVGRVQEHIAAGEVYQLVLSIQYAGRCDLSPFDAYRALRRLNPAPYMFYCELGEHVLVGASPEALVKLERGRAQLRPIAGTYPRLGSGSCAAQQAAFLDDPKEHAEHVMLVDLARNDLGRVARPGTIEVQPYRHVEHYSHVMHLVSGVHGELAHGMDGFDLYAAAFPAGTLVGAPKVRAMQIIAELEPMPRGFYAGAVGYFGRGRNGGCHSLDHAITIRTLQFRGDTYCFQAGAGVVAESDPAREYEEVLAKTAVLRATLAQVREGL